MNPDLISEHLDTRFIGQRLLYFPSIVSTMDIARQEALKKAAEGTAVLTDRQTAGRGRLKRRWLTPEGNIALSVILYPPRTYLPSLIMLSSLAVKDAIKKVTGIECQLKWPNDVLIEGKKVSGILIETKTQIDRVDYAIIGIGINVNMQPSDYSEIQSIATSLADATGQPVSRENLVRQLFVEMEKLYSGSLAGDSLFSRWRDSLITLGKRVQARHEDEVFEGIAEDVEETGCLLLRPSNGNFLRLTIGDVTLRE